jgi:hypothetical protein
MALWGHKDSKTASGTINIADTGAVTGTSTAFTTQAKIGNTIKAGGVDYQIVTITDDTHVKVVMGKNNGKGTVTTQSGASYTLSEKPAFVAHEASNVSGYPSSGDSNVVYGVDPTEAEFAGKVVNLQIGSAGSGYVENPGLSFTAAPGGGTNATGTATVSGGIVTVVAITNAGAGYTAVPSVTIAPPVMTVTASSVNLSLDTINYANHGQNTGDAVTYRNGGGTNITGLTNSTVYYVIKTTANAFKLATSAANATAGTAIDLTGQGNNAQNFLINAGTTATAAADLSSGTGDSPAITHSGWVRRTVGTGGRAGRVHYETLVATNTIQGDASDDAVLPEA